MSNRYNPNTGLPLDPALVNGAAEAPVPQPGQAPGQFAPPGQLPFGTPAAATAPQYAQPTPSQSAHLPEQATAHDPAHDPALAPYDPASFAPAPFAPAPFTPEPYEPPPYDPAAHEPTSYEQMLGSMPEVDVAHEPVAPAPEAYSPPDHEQARHDRAEQAELPTAPAPSPITAANGAPFGAPFHASPGVAPFVPPSTAPAAKADASITSLLRVLAPLLAVVALIVHFVMVRWVEGWWWDDLAVGALVAGLAVGGALSVRHGVSATYLATALALPVALGAVGSLALDLRFDAVSSDAAAQVAASQNADRESAGDAPSADPIKDAVDAPVAFGNTATVQGFEVKLTEATCGLSVIPDGQRGEEYWDDASKKRFRDATPAPGEEFCVISSSWTNTTSAPLLRLHTQSLEQVHASNGNTYSANDEDAGVAYVLNEDNDFLGDVNPGGIATYTSVVSVPSGSTVTHAVIQRTGTTADTLSAATAFSLN